MKYKSWRIHHEPVVLELVGKVPAFEIAQQLGITRRCLSGHCSRHGISLALRPDIKPKLRRKRMRLHQKANQLWRPVNAQL